ncbi:hypothetical protein CIK05_06525 [Bdellovibrio sp. qaytius]|nr:hypothetical protein CIK05_06525 [Bdellovibrio sp. qaytius]
MISILENNVFFIVLNKPEGVSVHNEKPSLLDWLVERKLPQSFVNRIDQQTSGLVVVAHDPKDHEALTQSLQSGQKIYRALLRGGWNDKPHSLQWDLPLSDKAEGRKNPQGKASDRKNCLTLVNVVRTNQYFTEVLCEIKTGRQHQIRKHAVLAKHAIMGDTRYNDESYNLKMGAMYKTERMFLHAEELKFKFQGKEYHIKSEKMNCDMFFPST